MNEFLKDLAFRKTELYIGESPAEAQNAYREEDRNVDQSALRRSFTWRLLT